MMKRVYVDRAKMAAVLKLAAMATNPHSTIPEYRGVLLEAEGDRLQVRATDGYIWFRGNVAALPDEPFSTLVSIGPLRRLVDAMAPGGFMLALEDERLVVEQGMKASIAANDPVDYPGWSGSWDGAYAEFDRKAFTQGLSRVLVVTSDDETRPALMHTHIVKHTDGRVTLEGSDSYRALIVDGGHVGEEFTGRAYIDKRTAKLLLAMAKGTDAAPQMSWDEEGLRGWWRIGDCEVRDTQMSDKHPTLAALIPAESEHTFTVDRKAALAMCNAFMKAIGRGTVRLSFSADLLRVETTQQVLDLVGTSCCGELPVAESSGGDGVFGVNLEFLRDGFATLAGDTVEVQYRAPLRPLGLVSGGDVHLIMPVRLD